jgi:hypothetical protein
MFKALVQRYRRRYVDRALGRLAKGVAGSAAEIVRLALKGKSEAVRLQAARAVLAELINMSNHADLAARVGELERRCSDNDRSDEPRESA